MARIIVRPLTPRRWPDLEKLFGPRGACGGCWCMYWRLPRKEYERRRGEGNRRALRRLAAVKPPPGLLAYLDAQPIGWCALAPREAYPVLDRSRVLARVDENPVWSVVCFFVARHHRGRGVSRALARAAVAFARKRGARIVEGYPVAPRSARAPDVFVYTGLPGTFLSAGFKEVARRSPTRPILRRALR